MDLSFFTSAGGNAWSLAECAGWASENGFDAVRLSAGGAVDPDRILAGGPDEVNDTLKNHGVYLAALSAHNNLLDDACARPSWRLRPWARRWSSPMPAVPWAGISTVSFRHRPGTRATGQRNWSTAFGIDTSPS